MMRTIVFWLNLQFCCGWNLQLFQATGNTANVLQGFPYPQTPARALISGKVAPIPLQCHDPGDCASAFPLPLKGCGRLLHELGSQPPRLNITTFEYLHVAP